MGVRLRAHHALAAASGEPVLAMSAGLMRKRTRVHPVVAVRASAAGGGSQQEGATKTRLAADRTGAAWRTCRTRTGRLWCRRRAQPRRYRRPPA